LQSQSVFGVGDGVHDGVYNGHAFGGQSCQGGDQRCDVISFSKGSVKDDDDVGRPQSHPQGNVDQVNFGDVNVEAAGSGNLVGAQRHGVHFDCLSAEVLLAFGNGSDDVEVAEEDDEQRNAIVDGKHGESVGKRRQIAG